MADVPTSTYTQVGIREDLSDTIWDVSPEEVPFSSGCKRTSVDSTLFEWQTDALADVSATTAVEGADPVFTAASATTRLQNQTEIIEKTAMISGTVEATDRAGRDTEMAYQVIKRGKEVKRDFEHHLVGVHNVKAAGNASTARETASYATWCNANVSFGSGGDAADGDGDDVPTVGTARALTEALLGAVVDSCFTNGGNPDTLMANAAQKRVITGFAGNANAGNATAFNTVHDNSDKTVINAVSLYVSDYGTMKVVPNRFLKVTDVLVYEKEFWKIGVLRDMKNTQIAKTGDAEKRQVLMEAGLIACNEKSSGIILSLS